MNNSRNIFIALCAFSFSLFNLCNNLDAAQRDIKQVKTTASTSLFKRLFILWAGFNLIETSSARKISPDEKITATMLNSGETFLVSYKEIFENTPRLLDVAIEHLAHDAAKREFYYMKYFEGLDLDDATTLLTMYLEQHANTPEKEDAIRKAYTNYLSDRTKTFLKTTATKSRKPNDR